MSREIRFRAWEEGKYEIGSDGSIWSTDFNHTGKRKARAASSRVMSTYNKQRYAKAA